MDTISQTLTKNSTSSHNIIIFIIFIALIFFSYYSPIFLRSWWTWRYRQNTFIPKTELFTPQEIPFLYQCDPDWICISKVLDVYNENFQKGILGGLSRSLEICLKSENEMGLEGGVMSKAIQNKIETLSTLHDLDFQILQKFLQFPKSRNNQSFAWKKMLPRHNTQPTNSNQIFDHNKENSFSEIPCRYQDKFSFTTSSSYDSITQIVAHLVRDWSEKGRTIRESIYDWCIYHVELSRGAKTILIPGAGLGRLAWELAIKGNHVEANEVSTTMATVSFNILNAFRTDVSEFILHPFVTDYFVNEVDSKNRYQSVKIEPIQQNYIMKGTLSYTISDFVEYYGSHALINHGYDIIITCFFLDTATNVMEYISAISDQLHIGGKWINVGPLQWHQNAQLRPAADEFRLLVESFGFTIQTWSVDKTPVDYRMFESSPNSRFTKYEGYLPLRMTAVLEKKKKKRNLTRLPKVVRPSQ